MNVLVHASLALTGLFSYGYALLFWSIVAALFMGLDVVTVPVGAGLLMLATAMQSMAIERGHWRWVLVAQGVALASVLIPVALTP